MIRLEDDFQDVIGKAMAGLRIGSDELAVKSGLDKAAAESLLNGTFNAQALRAVALALGLAPEPLVAMGEFAWYPQTALPDWVRLFNTAFPVPGYAEMTVNNYIFWNGNEAFAIDTGADAGPLLAEVESRGLRLKGLLLTHTHRDHIAALDAVRAAHPDLSVYCPEGELIDDTAPLAAGEILPCGELNVETRLTAGHSPGALSYVISGESGTLAFVGDALFCLSMGKAAHSYKTAIQQIREQILSLPGATLLCPGHGPVTTVGNERTRNPFFAEVVLL